MAAPSPAAAVDGADVRHNPAWTLALPIAGIAALALSWLVPAMPGLQLVLGLGLVGSVVAAVHHAEVIAHRVGEPYGTLVLALAVTVIEVALIVSLMYAHGAGAATLARDTIFAAVMIILNGIIGISLLAGARRHFEQDFRTQGMVAALATLAVITVFALVLPNVVTSRPGPLYSDSQLAFIAVAILTLFAGFTFVQTVRHRDYFLPPGPGDDDPERHAAPPSRREAGASLVLLLLALGAVVWSAKGMSPVIKRALDAVGAPAATLGILIAAIVLMPEGIAAVRAALHNRLQTSLNLAISSAIGLTVPVVAIIALASGWPLVLGLDAKSTLLLALTLFVVSLSFHTGRTNVLLGLVHLVLFATYLFMSLVP